MMSFAGATAAAEDFLQPLSVQLLPVTLALTDHQLRICIPVQLCGVFLSE